MKTLSQFVKAVRIPALFAATLLFAACGGKRGGDGTMTSSGDDGGVTENRSTHFDAVSKHLDLGGPVYGYVDIDGDLDRMADYVRKMIDGIREVAGDEMPPQVANLDLKRILADLGLSQIDAIGMSSHDKGDYYRNAMYVHTPGGREGLMKLFGSKAGPFAAKSLAPADADLVYELDLDLKSVFKTVEDLVKKVGGAEVAGEFVREVSQPTPIGMSIADIFAELDTKVTVIGRLHPDRPLQIPEAPVKVPGFDLLIAVDNMSGLYGKVTRQMKAEMPPQQVEQMIRPGDGYEQIVLPVPPEVQQFVQPVIRHDEKSGRLLVASSAAWLDECLSGKSSVWDAEDFQKMTAGFPEEGNYLVYYSPTMVKEYTSLYSEILKAASGMPAGAMEQAIVGMLQGFMGTEHGVASVVSHLPEGTLMLYNGPTTHKAIAGMTAAGMMASMGAAAFTTTRARAVKVEELQEARIQEIEAIERAAREIAPDVPPVPVPSPPVSSPPSITPEPVPVPEDR